MNGCILLHPNQIIKRIKRAYREIDLVIFHKNDVFYFNYTIFKDKTQSISYRL